MVCSTPRGITATTGSPSRRNFAASPSAQRLAASRRRRAALEAIEARGRALCSTPRGITATTGTRVSTRGQSVRCAQRLAASRRRRGTSRASRSGTTVRAQRLAASRRRRESRCRRGRRWSECAQRLAASRRRRVSSRTASRRARGRCSTPRGITATTGVAAPPLRALERPRAQRLAASRRRRGGGVPRAARHPQVLNASRHHGDDGYENHVAPIVDV